MRRVLAIILVLVMPAIATGMGNVHAFTGTTNLLGFIEEVDISSLSLTIDGDTVEIAPNTDVITISGRNKSIYDLTVGQFVDVNVIPYGKSWKASNIKLIPQKSIKSISSYIVSVRDNTLILGSGMKLIIPKKTKLIGFDEFERDMMIKIDGYISKGKLVIWKFTAPYTSTTESYTFCGKLTNLQEDKLIINSKIVVLHNDIVLWDEMGWKIPDLNLESGMTIRVVCEVRSNLLFAKRCELFESIHLKLKNGSDIATINNRETIFDTPLKQHKKITLIPIKAIFEKCGLNLFINNGGGIISTNINGLSISYHINSGDIYEENTLVKTIKLNHVLKENDEYMIPLKAFAYLFCKSNYVRYPLLASKEEVVFYRY